MEIVHFIPASQRRMVILASHTDTACALISGGPGTGKGAIAKWIHANGPRAAKPLITSEKDRPLLEQLQAAQGGTFVIPEIGNYTLAEQTQLLSFLTTRSISSAGLRMLLNVRVIATTGKNLDEAVKAGLFNRELLNKLNVFHLEMPSLFRRTEEFEDIVTGIVGEISRELHKEHLKGLDQTAWHQLKAYDWPGNLRELRNVLRVAIIAAQGDRVESTDFPNYGHSHIDFLASREKFEKIYITELLKTFNWKIDETCRMTHMDKATLLAKITQYGINVSELTGLP